MRHEVVSMNFLEWTIFVTEVAPFSIWTELLAVELTAVLRFVLVVEPCLGFGDPIDLCKFVRTVCVLAFEAVPAETNFCPILTHFSLILFGIRQRYHLPVLQESDRLITLVNCFRGIELTRLLHNSCCLNRRNKVLTVFLTKWEGVSVDTRTIKSKCLVKGYRRNWSECVVCILGNETLEISLHHELGRLVGLHELRKLFCHIWNEWFAVHVAFKGYTWCSWLKGWAEHWVLICYEDVLDWLHSSK